MDLADDFADTAVLGEYSSFIIIFSFTNAIIK